MVQSTFGLSREDPGTVMHRRDMWDRAGLADHHPMLHDILCSPFTQPLARGGQYRDINGVGKNENQNKPKNGTCLQLSLP